MMPLEQIIIAYLVFYLMPVFTALLSRTELRKMAKEIFDGPTITSRNRNGMQFLKNSFK